LTGSAPYQNSNPAVVITQHLSAPPPQIGERRPELADLDPVFAKVLAKEPDDRYPSCSDFATALTGQPSSAAVDTVEAAAMAQTTPAPVASAPPKQRRGMLRPAMLISAIATVVVVAAAVIVGAQLLHGHANQPSNRPTAAPQPSTGASAAPGPSIQLAKHVTDQSGVLGAPGLTAVNRALSNLYHQRNIHLWVAYVNDFSGVTPFRWAKDTMAANGFTNTDALLAVATANRSFAFRVPTAMTGGTNLTVAEVEQIRRDRIAPAVANGEWARAAVAAASGLESAAG
jgi:serine/threonine-protein kinase